MKPEKWIAALCAAMALAVVGCGMDGQDREANVPEKTEQEQSYEETLKEEYPAAGEILLRDKDALYQNDDEGSVVTMYLTVRRGNNAEGTNHSWSEINSYSAYDYDQMGIDRYQVEGLLQVGDEAGPAAGALGYGETVPNATVQIRGQTSSRYAQKSYKIRIKDNKGLWNSQQTINLNKHQTDGTRFRNKLGFDLIKGLPQMMSLRTQFVQLYVKDETEGAQTGFVDYGLYTQVEQLNKRGMRSHGLDPNGHLYKINFCEFYRYEDIIKPATDPDFNEHAFEAILECKGNNDHTKLMRMLDAVNDYSISSEELLDTYFNRENLTYWMAYHILTGNIDTESRNFYIYSPQNMDTWYILSWDLDDSFKYTENLLKSWSDYGAWQRGVSNYWGNMLFRRCLKSDDFRRQLDLAAEDLRGYLTEDRIVAQIKTYRKVTESYIWNMPDMVYEPLTKDGYNQVAEERDGAWKSISTNIVISLGMVGALSIVRFRTAVKDPMDLLYLFWAITTGITMGAGMYVLAFCAALVVIVMLAVFYHKQQSGEVYIAVIHYDGDGTGDQILQALGKQKYFVKSKTFRGESAEMAVEVLCRHGDLFFAEKIRNMERVKDITLIQYNGEYHG